MNEKLIALRLDREDLALLHGLVRVEKLTTSDIVRRALRFYARHMGVKELRCLKGPRQRRTAKQSSRTD
jgi:hypothetical protein